MLPWQSAKHWWAEHSTQDFWEAVGEHLSAGYVWNSPEFFLMGHARCWNAEEQNFESGTPNCWHVTLAASAGCKNPVEEAMRIFPYPQQYMSWFRGARDGRIRIHRWDKLEKATRRK
jgi:hypothetical protein